MTAFLKFIISYAIAKYVYLYKILKNDYEIIQQTEKCSVIITKYQRY